MRSLLLIGDAEKMKMITTSCKLISKNCREKDPHGFRSNCSKIKYQVALRKEKFPEYFEEQ